MKSTFNAQILNTTITFTNNLFQPIVKITLSEFSVGVTQNKNINFLECNTVIGLLMESFNQRPMAWEPFIEPSSFQI